MICIHSHPFDKSDKVKYSWADNRGEAVSAKTVTECLEGRPMGSILLGQKSMAGRLWLSNGSCINIDEVRIFGNNIRHIDLSKKARCLDKLQEELYARQILAFGKQGQIFLSTLKIGVVGLGGTGSSVAEQLARLGVNDFVLIDHDEIEESNKTRIYGSYKKEDGNKVDIAKSNILRISPNSTVLALKQNVMTPDALNELKEADIIFSCVDRHAPRSILNELSYQFFIPVFDMGVGVTSKDGRITGGQLRASLIAPHRSCFYCNGIINSDAISYEVLSREEREKQIKEGYVQGLYEEPAVISLTTQAAAMAVSLMLDTYLRLFGDMGRSIYVDLNDNRVDKINARKRHDCVCTKKLGYGDYENLSV